METPVSNAREVQEIIESWAASVRSRDIAGVLRNHADSFLMFDVVGPIETRGLDSYRKAWLEQFFPWHGDSGRFDLKNLRVSAGDRVAFATALLECAGTENSQSVGFTLRLTVGLEKIGGEWAIVHEHHSEPLPFDQSHIGEGAERA